MDRLKDATGDGGEFREDAQSHDIRPSHEI